jgi:glycosyltransferase involved in cell wall biosynthesis
MPIEPIDLRYSNQWAKWFTQEFQRAGVNHLTIHGDSNKKTIDFGSFLDVMETNRYKTWQTTALISTLMQYKDDYPLILFFHDLWHPGLSQLAYIRDGMGWENMKICGCLHAGSYDEYDFLNKVGMTDWAMFTERAWFGVIADQIYVATDFHKNLLCSTRAVPPVKVVVTGFPMYPDFNRGKEKRDIVVFPHRLDSEKQPEKFHELERYYQGRKNWFWHKTKEDTETKEEYYDLLSISKVAVSFALQETWGIAMQEAVLCGAVPLVPARLSYPELYLRKFVYEDLRDLRKKLEQYMTVPPVLSLSKQQKLILDRGAEAIPNMIREMKNLAK